jgi:predicted GNAT family acetyltransferase
MSPVTDPSTGRVTNNVAAHRFELIEDGLVSFADYRRSPGRLIIDHVEAPPALRGTGSAGRLMEGVARAAREQGLRITPLCGYAAAWLRRHREHSDLIG